MKRNSILHPPKVDTHWPSIHWEYYVSALMITFSALQFIGSDQEIHTEARPSRQVENIDGLPLGPHTPRRRFPLYIMDSGVDANHPQIRGTILAQRDFTGEGLQDDFGHGTRVVLFALSQSYELENQLSPSAIGHSDDPKLPGIIMAKVIGIEPVDEEVMNERLMKAQEWFASLSL